VFLIHTLLVFVTIYAISAVLAEIIFSSHAERKLPPAVRVGLGYFLSLFYFVSAWLFMSIRQAWLLGLVLLALYVYGKTSKGLLNLEWTFLKGLLKKHAKVLGIFLLSANLFFLPLHIASEYGPFSEGGGDVSVYSDVAKRLTDFNLNAVGLEENASLKDRFQGVKNIVSQAYSERYKAMELDLTNPPNADYQSNKLAFNSHLNPIQYTPCAQFAFLSSETNYPIFFALMAFLYTLILASAWGFFYRFGLLPAVLSVLIVGGSHSLVSAFYNMYLLQVLSTTFLALTLAAVPFVRLFSIAGFKIYGICSAFISISYLHFMPIIFPLLGIAAITTFYTDSKSMDKREPDSKAGLFPTLCHLVARIIFFSFCLAGVIVGCKAALQLAIKLFRGFLSNNANPSFSGESVLVFSDRWWAYFFGLASQQQFQPYMFESEVVGVLVHWAIPWGFLIFGAGLVLWISKIIDNIKIRQNIAIYIVLAITVGVYLMMSQNSQYTQAKSAQYLLICVYFLMLLPLAQVYREDGTLGLKNFFPSSGKRNSVFLATTIYIFLLFGFSIFLWVPRVVYAGKIALHKDRSSIMEPSFFSEARRIKVEDKNAFVLFEPRISADAYFPYQSFSGYQLIPTRHLVLLQLIAKGASFEKRKQIPKLPSDFIKVGDLNHLWNLTAVRKREGKYRWQGEKLTHKKTPDLIFTGHDYQRDFGVKSRTKKADILSHPDEGGMFSYLRNGTVMIYLPPGGPYHLVVKVYNRNAEDLEAFDFMVNEIGERVDSGEFESFASMEKKDGIITLVFDFEASAIPRLSLVSRFSSEYWFNARLNGKEMISSAVK
jgi:hypothetical protein